MVTKRKAPKRFLIKRVPKAFKLPIQTVTFVPSTTNKSQPITNAQFTKRVQRTRRFLSDTFGGYTSVRGVGGFVLKGKVIREKVVAVTAFSEMPTFKRNKKKWLSWVRARKKEWKQESMGIIIENDLFFV